MNHADHVRLLHRGVSPGGVWADLGSGTGAFTLALAELLGGGIIYSVDRDARALREQERTARVRAPSAEIRTLNADFTRPIVLPPLDGLVMANSLHFVRDKEPVVRLLRAYLKSGGIFLLVEYNVDSGNPWVPYPISYPVWEQLAHKCGFANTRLLDTQPSRFLGQIYSAASAAPDEKPDRP